MRMRNSKSMLALVRAEAIARGPRRFGLLAGYALTEKELKTLSIREGFSTTRKTIPGYLEDWAFLGEIRGYPAGEDKTKVYFVRLDNIEDRSLISKAEEAYPTLTWSDDFSGVRCA